MIETHLILNSRSRLSSCPSFLLLFYPSLGLRWAHKMLSLRIHLPSPPPPPHLRCYHDNIDCSLQLKQPSLIRVLSLSQSLSLFSSESFSGVLILFLISQSVSSPLSCFTGERGKWDVTQKNKSPTRTLNPTALDLNWVVEPWSESRHPINHP